MCALQSEGDVTFLVEAHTKDYHYKILASQGIPPRESQPLAKPHDYTVRRSLLGDNRQSCKDSDDGEDLKIDLPMAKLQLKSTRSGVQSF